MNIKRFFVSVVIAIGFFLSGCSSNQGQGTASPVPLQTITAALPVPIQTSTATTEPTITPTHLPTSTPTPAVTNTISPTPDDGKYRPPQGNYACDFSSIQLLSGSKLREYYKGSSFGTVLSDDFGTWYSIEYFRILDEDLPIPKAFEDRQKYLDFDLNFLMESRIKPEVPQGKIIEQEYIQTDSPILYAALDLPGGSNMWVNDEPADATRAVYIVIHGAYSYVISTQFSDLFSREKTQEEIIQELKQDLEDFYATCEFETNPDVGRNFVQPTITPIPKPIDYIPDMKIPDGLFSPDAGSSNVDQFETVLFAQGDWILVKNFHAIFPIPAGWTTTETGQETRIEFSPDGNLEHPLLLIRLGGVGYIGDKRTSEEVMAEFESGLSDIPSAVLLEKKIVDASKGYIFLTLITSDGQKHNLMVLFSEDVQGFYHRFLMYVDPEEWDNYYPIVRAIVDHWVDLDFSPLGMPLPDEVPTENAQSLCATPYPQGTWEIVPDAQAAFPADDWINVLAVDKLGRLWAGTSAGLSMLGSDGKWTNNTPDNSDSDTGVWNLAIDEQNRVWSAAGGSIIVFDPSSGTWTTKLKDFEGNFLPPDAFLTYAVQSCNTRSDLS